MDISVVSEISLSDDCAKANILYDFSRAGIYRFILRGMKVDVFISIKGVKDVILWCGQSAITSSQIDSLPVFHRISWVNDFDCSVVIFNDPTLYLYPGLLGGWYQGTRQDFAINMMDHICQILKYNINSRARSIYYGSSAGGFWAIMMSAKSKSVCMAEIPQMDMFKYPYVGPREILLDRCYRDAGLNPIDYTDRLRCFDWFKKIDSLPQAIHIYQNINDVPHTTTQLEPFQKDMASIGYDDLYVTMYGVPAEGNGHQAMDKGKSVIALRRLLFEPQEI
jgi:hypothetical protein